MIRDFKNGEFWFSWDRICHTLRRVYNMSDDEMFKFLKDQTFKHLNWEITKIGRID